MPKDVLLIISDPPVRARLRILLDKMSEEFCFLDEAENGVIGLEKAITMNPDIVIVSRYPLLIHLEQLLDRLSESNFIGRVVVIGERRDIGAPLEYSNPLFRIAQEGLDEKKLRRVLGEVVRVETPFFREINQNMYQSLLECASATDFVVLKDKYQLDVHANSRLWLLSFKAQGAAGSAAGTVDAHWEEWKAILTRYRNGYIFYNQNCVFFLVNDTAKIQDLILELYRSCRQLTEKDVVLFVSDPVNRFSELAPCLRRAEEWLRLAFFRKNTGILYEEQIRGERTDLTENVFAEQIYAIRYDIVENDPLSLEQDLRDCMLGQMKKGMDYNSYQRLLDDLGFICGDLAVICNLHGTEPLNVKNCEFVEDAFEQTRVQLLDLMSRMNPSMGDSPVIGQAVRYIRENYAKEFGLKELSDELHISSAYLSHLFSQKVGVSFSDYLCQIRLRHAKRLLETGKKKIYEVALESGFGNAKYFCRIFKERTAMTPREYQKKFMTERSG